MLSTVLLSVAALAAQDSAHLVIVATTDVHGHATAWNYLTNRPYPGGLARAATAVDSLRTRYPDRVILLDAGDLLQGDPFADYFARVAPREPNPIVDAMNLMGYDAATMGNHDFDYGLETLSRELVGAAFPYVSANVSLGGSVALPPTAIVQRGEVRVAVTGFTTPGVMVWSRHHVEGRAQVASIMDVAEGALADARERADVSVVLAHSGLRGGSAYDTAGVGPEHVAARLADLPAAPDLVVVGHSHREIVDTTINGVHFIQPLPYARSLAVAHVHLVRRRSRWEVTRIVGDRIPLDRVEPDRRIERRLWTDHQAVLTWVGAPLGQATQAMPATLAQAEPTPIMNFIHDAQRRRTGAHLSAAAAFNLQAGFPAGAIRVADIAALYPYENTLRAIEVTGAQLKAFLEHSVRYFAVRDGRITINDSIPGYNYDMVAGADYQVDLSQPVGARIVGLSVGGLTVAESDVYRLALNSYRQAGGGGYRMLAGARVVYDRGENVRDVLIEAVRTRGVVDPADFDTTNWSIVPEDANVAVRSLFLPAVEDGAAEQPVLRIVAINDLEGTLVADDTVPVAASLKTALDEAAQACDCPVLRVSAGDQLGGTPVADLSFGRATLEVLNHFDLTAVSLGPGDLSWPLDTLGRRADQSSFAWVTGNVVDRMAGARPVWLRSSLLVDAGGRRVALIGYLSPTVAAQAQSDDLPTLQVQQAADVLPALVDHVLEQGGADLVVVMAQATHECSVRGCTEELYELATTLEGVGVDLIVAGGAAIEIDTTVAGIPIVQAAPRGAGWATVDLLPTLEGVQWRTALHRLPGGVRPDSAVVAVVAEYQADVDALVQRDVARIRLPLPKRDGPSSLSLLVADAFRNAERAEVGLVPLDLIAAGLDAGRVTYGDLLAVLPSRRRVVTVRLTGADLTALIERALTGAVPTIDLSGATVRYDPQRDAGDRVRRLRLLDGRDVRDKDVYSVAVPDHFVRASGGLDGQAEPAHSAGYTGVDALDRYLQRLPQPVEPPRGDRFESTR